MTRHYLRAVRSNLSGVSAGDRKHALDALAAQLSELRDAGIDPETVLGDAVSYAERLRAALTDESPIEDAQWRVLGLPFETRGPVNAGVRSRIWDPANSRLIVPRLFGIGWTLNLGALAVKLGFIRPDDVSEDVLSHIPERDLRGAQLTPLVLAGVTTAVLAVSWRRLPPTVIASGLGVSGRQQKQVPRGSLIGATVLGALPALWCARKKNAAAEDRLVSAASATSLAVISASTVAATILQTRHPRGQWGLLVPVALPISVVASLAVIIGPMRSGLRAAWRAAAKEPRSQKPQKEQA